MFIINQDRNVMVNTDHIINIYVEDTKVQARTSAGYTVLGIYDHHENRADEVFKEMLGNMFIPNLVAVNTVVTEDYAEKFKSFANKPWGIAIGPGEDIKPFNREVYYMPEE